MSVEEINLGASSAQAQSQSRGGGSGDIGIVLAALGNPAPLQRQSGGGGGNAEGFDFSPNDLFKGMDEEKAPKVAKSKDDALVKRELHKFQTRKTKAEIEDCQKLISQLTQYANSKRFKEYLAENGFKLSPTHLRGLDEEELDDLLIRVRACVRNKSDSTLASSLVLFGVRTVEGITQVPAINARVDLLGLSKCIENDPQFLDALEEYQLEHSLLAAMSPEKRLLFCLGTTAFRVNAQNQMAKALLAKSGMLPQQVQQALQTQTQPAATSPEPDVAPGATKIEEQERKSDPDYTPDDVEMLQTQETKETKESKRDTSGNFRTTKKNRGQPEFYSDAELGLATNSSQLGLGGEPPQSQMPVKKRKT